MQLSDALRGRNNNLDILRLVAASMVIYGHAPLFSSGTSPDAIALLLGPTDYSGSIAVKFFFFVSGLVVTNSLLESRAPVKWMVARVFRLFPALIGTLVFSVFVLGAWFTQLPLGDYFRASETWSYIGSNATDLVRNCCMSWHLPGVFETHPSRAINGSLWTLPSEFYCYLVVLVVFLLTGFRGEAVLSGGLIALGVASLLFPSQVGILAPGAQGEGLLASFSTGMVFALMKDSIPLRGDMAFGLILGAVLARSSVFFPVAYCLAIFYGSLVLATWQPIMRLRLKSDLSYGVYLYGWPMQQAVLSYLPWLDRYTHTALALSLALLLAACSWFLIEARCIRLGKRVAAFLDVRADAGLGVNRNVAV